MSHPIATLANMCSVCEQFEAAGTLDGSGAVAQLVERLHGMQEVVDSSSISSTQFLPALLRLWRTIGFTLGGFVAGEGSFIVTTRQPPFKDGTPKRRFVFQVALATRDRPMLEALRAFLGFGCINDRLPARAHWQPESVFTIASQKAHRAATIPFADEFLLPSAKRTQFERWRSALVAYENERPTRYGKGRSPCSVPGCDKPVRGRMLCRSHYYRATGY
jgi:hypothetical protein